ncbi:MAG: DUF3467 domain-containing protein [Albimonas sp.]|uniref:DUF3467 domain-containing protein n=1 Tax=Albimonas sp. TaxID=1872425 RepID=UPI004055BE33|tara:strand:+ start:899 stop:1162 length:264 start_codon:yes stop_codon:yes gene_type:complete
MAQTPEHGRNATQDAGPRAYVNALSVDFTLAEFTLDFLQAFGGPAPQAGARLVTAPANMPLFRDALAAAIADYERRYGALAPQGGAR